MPGAAGSKSSRSIVQGMDSRSSCSMVGYGRDYSPGVHGHLPSSFDADLAATVSEIHAVVAVSGCRLFVGILYKSSPDRRHNHHPIAPSSEVYTVPGGPVASAFSKETAARCTSAVLTSEPCGAVHHMWGVRYPLN